MFANESQHPRDYPINKESRGRSAMDGHTFDGPEEARFCWEEIGQLNTAISLLEYDRDLYRKEAEAANLALRELRQNAEAAGLA